MDSEANPPGTPVDECQCRGGDELTWLLGDSEINDDRAHAGLLNGALRNLNSLVLA
jgi:hypothetical protein